MIMKKFNFKLILGFTLSFVFMLTGCKEEKEDIAAQLVGHPGNPRFNLVFTNEENVDLDLYVIDPNGEKIYYGNTFSTSGGTLDVDCLCGDCTQGPNENIYWPEDGSSPSGVYQYWVEHFESCITSGSSSSFTLRVLQNGTIKDTKTGSLSSGSSTIWTFTKN